MLDMIKTILFFLMQPFSGAVRKSNEDTRRSRHPDRAIILAIATGNESLIEDLLASGVFQANGSLCAASGKKFSPLHVACMYGQAEMARKFISGQADINCKDEDGCSPVFFASVEGHYETVELLVRLNADVNQQSHSSGSSPLYVASKGGHLKVVNLLIEARANVNSKAKNGASPLLIAAQNGHYQVVRSLLKQLADVGIQTADGATALYCASQNGHHKVVEALIQAQADVNLPTKEGVTPLFVAAYLNRLQVAKLLIESYADIDLRTKDGDSPLYTASQNEHEKMAEMLVKAGANVNARTTGGESPIYVAAFRANSQIIDSLIEARADANQKSKSGVTPLYVAALHGHTAIVDALIIQAHCDVNIQTVEGSTPLFAACQNGHQQVAASLIAAQANLNLLNSLGASPLYIASQNGHHELVRSLLRAQADVNLQRTSGESPLFIASLNGHPSVVSLLLKAQADVDIRQNLGGTPIYIASQKGHSKVVDILIKAQADVDVQQLDGGTPIYIACQTGNREVFKLLAKAQANANIQTKTGLSPLFIASQNGHENLVDWLIEARVDVNAQDEERCTPLYMASQNGHLRIVNSLLIAGADVSIQTVTGESALFIATHNGHRDVASLLTVAMNNNRLQNFSCLDRRPNHLSTGSIFLRAEPAPSDSELSLQLHSALTKAGFVESRAAMQAAVADVLQKMLRSRRDSFEGIFIVGSYSEAWGNNLTSLDGKTDSESDIDVMKLLQGRIYHLKGVCKCQGVESEQVEYSDGHILCSGFTASPAKPSSGTPMRPAVDEVDACRLCRYPSIGPLLTSRLRHSKLSRQALDALRRELNASPCHVVHAAPPGQAGQQLRVSTTFLEKRLLRSLTTMQGQLFIVLKYLVKKVISHKDGYNVQGLKAYHAKTILFRILEETTEEDWRPEKLVYLTRRAVQMLLRCAVSNCTDSNKGGRIMDHFFLCDTTLYMKGVTPTSDQGMMKIFQSAIRALEDVLEQLPQILIKFKSCLKPLSGTGTFYFHPFQILPELRCAQIGEHPTLAYHEIYDVVRESLFRLSQRDRFTRLQQESLEQMIDRLPDCARSARIALKALVSLKLGYRDVAVQALSQTEDHTVSKGISWLTCRLPTEATEEFVLSYLTSCDSAWKFCFRFDERPSLSFLPKWIAEYFPFNVDSYERNAAFYINFDALLHCLRLELTPDDPIARNWISQVVRRDDADVQELAVCIGHCDDRGIRRLLLDKLNHLPVLHRLKEGLRRKIS